MDYLLSWIISVIMIKTTGTYADSGLFGVRLCQGQKPEVLACPYDTVIQFVDVIFSLSNTIPKDGKTCFGKEDCRKSASRDSIMSDRYDVCIRQTACDVDSRTEWISCPQLYMANYTEVIYTCVKSSEFSLTLPKNRTNGRHVTYGMSAEDAALRPSSTTPTPTTGSIVAPNTPSATESTTETKKPPIWKPVTETPTFREESTIILAAVLAFVVLAFCCVICGFAFALKRGRIDKKKLPRCLVRSNAELRPEHVYADIDYATMYPRGRGAAAATVVAASPETVDAATLRGQQILRLPYMEFVHTSGHLTPLPRTDPYYFLYDPAHRIVIPGGPKGPHSADPLFRSSSVVLERHPHPLASPLHHHHHTHHRLGGPGGRSGCPQELPDLVHHESQGSGSINACFSEHNDDPSGVVEGERRSSRLSQLISTSLPDVSASPRRQSDSSESSTEGLGKGDTLGIPQTVVSRQVTIDSAFEDDFDNTDESHSSNNHLAIERTDSRFIMDSHEYLAPVASRDRPTRFSLSPGPGDIHKAPTKRVRGGAAVVLPPPRPSASTPCSPLNHVKGGPLSFRGNLVNKPTSPPSQKSKHRIVDVGRKKTLSDVGVEGPGRHDSLNAVSVARDTVLLENTKPDSTPPPRDKVDVDDSDLPPSHGLKFSASVRV